MVCAGYSLESVLAMTLAQFRAVGEAVTRRRQLQRTEHLVLLRGAKYSKKDYEALLKASRTAQWLTPA